MISGRTAVLLGALFLVGATLVGRMLWGAQCELAQADRAATQGDETARIRHLRRAMAFYMPGNPWVRAAKETLIAAARDAEQRGDRTLALHLWQDLRSAILALRHIVTPYRDALALANQRIAALTEETQPAQANRVSVAARRARLEQPEAPQPLIAAAALVGFLLWVGGAGSLLFFGLRPDRGCTRRFGPLAIVALVGFALFCAGLALA